MTEQPSMQELDEIVFGKTARGPRPGSTGLEPLVLVKVRQLTELDVTDIANGRPIVAQATPSPATMKHSHHQLARLIAQGKDLIEISMLTGYSSSYISSLKGGKDFQELIDYYANQREALFVDTLERMKVAGVTSLERLQALLDDDAEKWTKRELMEMAELMLLQPQIAARGTSGPPGSAAPGGPGGVTVNVRFVQVPQGVSPAPMIDITPGREEE